MQKTVAILILLALSLFLGGCSDSQQVENQAYVIAMGIDRQESGEIAITAQIPKISRGQEKSEGGSADSGSYMPLSASGPDYENALERLNWAVPRDLNLSQIKLIVLGRKLAEEGNCKDLFESISNTEQLFTAAQVAICEGSAKDFVSALSPVLGTRLSADISASLDHYLGLGIIPEATLANLNYLSHSVYSDPMAAFAVLSKEQPARETSALIGSAGDISGTVESGLRTRYLGSAVFKDGYLAGVLSGDQTVLTNAINNSLESFRYICGGESMEFTPAGKSHVNINTQTDPVRISIALTLSISDQDDIPPEEILRNTLEKDMRAVISLCQQMGADPFGFADIAAGQFFTLQQWQDYNWRSRFQEAQVDIDLYFSFADA